MYITEQINKQKRKYKQKETLTCNRPIHIAHYSHNRLGLSRKHFALASKITISRIKAGISSACSKYDNAYDCKTTSNWY